MKNSNSFWKFIDNYGTFTIENPQKISSLYFPLVNEANIMSSITPFLKGDIKIDNHSYLMTPTCRQDLILLESSRNFWVYFHKDKTALSLNINNPLDNTDKLDLECGFLYHKIKRHNKKSGLEMEAINFTPVTEDQVELMLVTLTNTSKKTLEITPTTAIPIYARGSDNIRDHRHVSSLLHRTKQDKHGVVVHPVMTFDERGHKENYNSYYVFGIEKENLSPIGSFPMQEKFTGQGRTLNNPEAVLHNLNPKKLTSSELNGKEAIGALRFKKCSLKPKESITYALLLGIAKGPKGLTKTFNKFNSISRIKNALCQNKDYWKEKINQLSFQTNNPLFDNWVKWVSLQPTLRKICGCSFLPDFDYGKGGKGWRDLWQDCLALLLKNPEEVKPLLVSNFGGVRIDGANATIVTNTPGKFIADRNKISRVWMDHGVWPFFTTELYINLTADLDILEEQTTYFRDAQIMRASAIDQEWDGYSFLKTKTGETYQGTVLEHILLQHLVQFFNVGPRNCIRLECADWNDGLDMAAEKGESVAFSAFYALNLKKIAGLLEKLKTIKNTRQIFVFKEMLPLLDTLHKGIDYNSVEEKIRIFSNYMESTKTNISGEKHQVEIERLIKDLNSKSQWLSQHIHDKEWIDLDKNTGFFNSYYDNLSSRLEGKYEKSIRMSLTGQVFTILSGIASDKQVEKTYHAAKKFLRDKKLKGFRLNTDFKELQPQMGRAFAFAYGEKENGAVFSHMCVMFAFALYNRGFVREGFEVLNSLFEMAVNSNTSKMYPNLCEYFNLEGQGFYSYLTGSASWFIFTLLTETFGVKGEFGNLVIYPKLVKEQFGPTKEISLNLNFAGKKININYLNPQRLDYKNYVIKDIQTLLPFQQKNDKEILIPREQIISHKNEVVSIRIILG